MHKKFMINRTKIKGGCQSGRKVVSHNSKSDLPLLPSPKGLLLKEERQGARKERGRGVTYQGQCEQPCNLVSQTNWDHPFCHVQLLTPRTTSITCKKAAARSFAI